MDKLMELNQEERRLKDGIDRLVNMEDAIVRVRQKKQMQLKSILGARAMKEMV